MAHLLKSISSPIVWILALLVMGIILAKYPRKKPYSKLGWLVVLAGTLALYLFSLGPISNLLVYSLECKCCSPPAEVLGTLDMVVILGEGVYPSNTFREYPEVTGVSYSRLFNGSKVFKQSSAVKLAVCGGGPIQTGETGGEVMRNLLVEFGVEESAIIAETESNNTMENATELAKLLGHTEKSRIGLVTSALHMPRSEKVFRRVFCEDTIVPIPVNYLYVPPEWNIASIIPSERALLKSAYAVHEWIGMVWYSIRY